MNAAAKAITQGTISASNIRGIFYSKQLVICFVLAIAILISAFTLIYVKDVNRRLFSQADILQQQSNQFKMEWTQLLLEQGAWSTQARVQSIAQEDLGFTFPSRRDVNIIRY